MLVILCICRVESRKTKNNLKRIIKTKCYIDKYNWEATKCPSEKDDWKNFEKNNLAVGLNVSCAKKEKIYLASK